MPSCIRPAGAQDGECIFLDIKAQPGASKSEITGIQENRLRIRIAAAPEDGRANGELVAFIAGLLRCPRKDVTVKTGEKSRLKTLAIKQAYRKNLEALIAGFH
jgi:uncharacterized protein (TIGR00251 family)